MRLSTRKAETERLQNQITDNHLTPAKIQRLKDELVRLETVDRAKAVSIMQLAAENGDFSENAAYQDAKRRLRRINSRIIHLTERISQAIPIEEGTDATGAIRLGSTVVVELNGNEQTFQIVGSQEVDITRGRISHTSPLGSMLLDRYAGDDVTVITVGGEIIYRVVSVE
ncbi:GreA/GreB family elongation factor [Candidatus Uhrbacteria bacterium]|nr:GreA/GreB family elongation factor [Candidatus Uhrbacteria bacterium]